MHASGEPPQRKGQDHAEAVGAVRGGDGARGCVGGVQGGHARGVPHHRVEAVAERARPVCEAGHPQGRHSPRSEEGDACRGEFELKKKWPHFVYFFCLMFCFLLLQSVVFGGGEGRGVATLSVFFFFVNSAGGLGATVTQDGYVRGGEWVMACLLLAALVS